MYLLYVLVIVIILGAINVVNLIVPSYEANQNVLSLLGGVPEGSHTSIIDVSRLSVQPPFRTLMEFAVAICLLTHSSILLTTKLPLTIQTPVNKN